MAFILVFALGKLLGVFLGNKIEQKLAYGLIEVDVYKHSEEGKILADLLRSQGYSVTTTIGYGIKGIERFMLRITLPRNGFSTLHELLKADGNVNMSVKPISQVYGKVGVIN
ncbi:MAG: hypothetical protein JXO44_00185 [Clostridia bacterium]|nr:hypothetical protein [Clostridia bacterium]